MTSSLIDRLAGIAEGLAVKAAVRVATTANIALTGEQTIDTVALVEGDRVLVKNQTTGSENGIYGVSTGNWARTDDFDGARDVIKGTRVFVTSGLVNKNLEFAVSTADPIVIGTTAITFDDLYALLVAGGSWGPFTDVASAATCDIGSVGTIFVNVTGTTTITSLGTATNRCRFVKFAGALTLTHNGTTLVLPGAENITTAAGDLAIFVSDSSSNWRCVTYAKASGAATVEGKNGGETDVASAATCDIGVAASERVRVTGTTTISSFGTAANKKRIVRFAGSLTLTYNATSMILPGAENIKTAAGDIAIVTSDASANWRVLSYQKASGAVTVEGKNDGETDVASATTCDIGAAVTERVQITGTATITSLGTAANKKRTIRFAGAATLTYNATTLILPTAANITATAGDVATAFSDGSGNWRITAYQRASGAALSGLSVTGLPASGGAMSYFATAGSGALTPSTTLFHDTAGRLVSPSASTTAIRPTKTAQNPLSNIYSGPNQTDSAIAVSNQWTKNTAGTPFVYNQISSIVYPTGDVWGVGLWGVGISSYVAGTTTYAWGAAGIGNVRGSLNGMARGAEFGALAGNDVSDPTGNYTNLYAMSLHAEGSLAGMYPTGILAMACTVDGAQPQQGIVLQDSAINPIKAGGSILATEFTAFATGSAHLSCGYGINLLNCTFSSYAFVYGTSGTPLFSVNAAGLVTAATGSSGGYAIGGAQVLTIASSLTQIKDPDGATRIFLGPAAAPTNYFDQTTHVARSRDGATVFSTLSAAGLVLATALGAASGGTGLATYAVGDMLYASAATTFSKLAAVAVGSVLVSGGLTTAPAWSASPSLTTSLTVPLLIGGSSTSQMLTLKTTTGVGATDSLAIVGGNNGATAFGTFNATKLDLPQTTDSTTTTSGALTIAGGLGVAKRLTVGGLTQISMANAAPGLQLTSTTGTNGVLMSYTNTAGTAYLGIDGSAGGLFTGISAYSMVFGTTGGIDIGFATNNTKRLTISANGNIVPGNAAALATNATDGFLYMQTCAGTPTGVPTAYTGRVAFVYDSTNNIIYIYNGAWKKTAALT